MALALSLQNFSLGDEVHIYTHLGGAAPVSQGPATTTIGTRSARASAASPATDWQRRSATTYTTTAGAAPQSGGTAVAATDLMRGTSADIGGFIWTAKAGINANQASCRTFFGVRAAAAAANMGALSTFVNCIGFGFEDTDATTANWKVYYNDAAGAPSTLDTGIARAATTGYTFVIACPAGQTTANVYMLDSTGAQVFGAQLTTDLPVNTVVLGWQLVMTRTAATTPTFDWTDITVQTRYKG